MVPPPLPNQLDPPASDLETAGANDKLGRDAILGELVLTVIMMC